MIDAISDRSITYAELLRRAASGALALRSYGLKPGDRVGIFLPNSAEFATLYFTCLIGGFTAVPINSALSLNDREYVLGHSRLSALIVASPSGQVAHNHAEPSLRNTGKTKTLLFRGFAEGSASEHEIVLGQADHADVLRLLSEVEDDQLFSIHFTSGTTNLPKGVTHQVARLLANAEAFGRSFGMDASARFLHVMPMAYMAGFLNTLLCPFVVGGSVVIAPQFTAHSALRFWEVVTVFRPNTFWVSPTMLATLLRVDRGSVGTKFCARELPRIFSATAPLPLKVRKDFFAKYGVDVVESYGLSELLLITANLGPAGSKYGAVGVPIAEAEIEIRSNDGTKMLPGVDGEVFTRTPHASPGYLNYETGEAEPFLDDWFDTGDVGHLDDDGYLFITGRKKDLIIRGGFNISPRQVEEVLLRHPAIEDVAVVGIPHDFYGEQIIAAVIVKSGYNLTTVEPDLLSACRANLAEYAIPDRLVGLVTFPTSTTGKVQKSKLREQIMAGTQP
ncbi:MAG TPA: class I adenylate-forming enzyme family protein [Pseudolabrys sp.]|nr:class I adenylate-forming enzyme family protein [Pseudolabrys sp.]